MASSAADAGRLSETNLEEATQPSGKSNMSNDETKSRPPLAESVVTRHSWQKWPLFHHPGSRVAVAKQSSSSSSTFSRKSADDGR